jgi:hypothetical protein
MEITVCLSPVCRFLLVGCDDTHVYFVHRRCDPSKHYAINADAFFTKNPSSIVVVAMHVCFLLEEPVEPLLSLSFKTDLSFCFITDRI